jgi:hypothetical protein
VRCFRHYLDRSETLMARMPRPWSKKRGSRLAARVFSGVMGEVLFFVTLFLVGLFGVALTLALLILRQVNREVPSGLVETGLGTWIFLTAAMVLVVIGVGGVTYRIMRIGASDERRAAFSRRRRRLELNTPRSQSTRPLPNVPPGSDLNNSPGIRLAFRLPATSSPVGRVAAAAVLALLWCGTWVVLTAVAISGIWWGTPRPTLTFLLLPLGAIGFWTARHFLRLLRESAGVGATIVEINDNPLAPGGTYRIYLAQYGKLKLRRLRIMLVCEEESIFRQGTDVRVDRHVASETTIFSDKSVSVDPGAPWEQEFDMLVPDDAMHSFQSPHNAVSWKILVEGESKPWPSFCRSFPVVVHPSRVQIDRDRR